MNPFIWAIIAGTVAITVLGLGLATDDPRAAALVLIGIFLAVGIIWCVRFSIRAVQDGPWPQRAYRRRNVTQTAATGAPYLSYGSTGTDCVSDALGSASCDGIS
jgi:hypothetical protein